jgi:hypothetical protein
MAQQFHWQEHIGFAGSRKTTESVLQKTGTNN